VILEVGEMKYFQADRVKNTKGRALLGKATDGGALCRSEKVFISSAIRQFWAGVETF